MKLCTFILLARCNLLETNLVVFQQFAVNDGSSRIRSEYLFSALTSVGEPLSKQELHDLQDIIGWNKGDKYINIAGNNYIVTIIGAFRMLFTYTLIIVITEIL